MKKHCTCTTCPVCQAEHMVCAKCGQCARCSNHLPNCTGCPASKAEYLENHGWQEVPSDVPGKTCWQAPTTKGHYFALEAAYALETEGEGIHAYAGETALVEALYAENVRRTEEAEEKYFRTTGKRHGNYPNY